MLAGLLSGFSESRIWFSRPAILCRHHHNKGDFQVLRMETIASGMMGGILFG